jgi:signal transduction histidine kinase/CheY-like chemotaxis protein
LLKSSQFSGFCGVTQTGTSSERGSGGGLRRRFAALRPAGFRRLRSKVTFAYLVLFALLLTGILSAVYSSIENNAERAVRQQLEASAVVFDRIWQLRTGELHDSAALLAKDFGFRAAVATRDAATIESALQNLSDRAGVDVAFVVGPDGKVIAVNGLPAAKSVELGAVAQDDDDATGVFVVDGAAYQAAVAPVTAPLPVGKVVFAARLDRSELAALTQLSAIPVEAHLLLKGPHGWIAGASDLSAAELSGASRAVARADPRAPRARRVERWEEVARPLRSLDAGRAALLLRYPLAAALAPYRALLALLLALAGIGLAAAAVGGAVLAREVTRPISRLQAAAERMEQGEAVQVPVEGRDEIATLSQAFNRMTGEIRRREAALEAARHVAESANRAKNDFLANMSHEIRTPLNGILGMAQVIRREAGDPEQQGRAKVIQDSGETLLAILNSILDLSKIEAGQLEVELSQFELAPAVRATVEPYAALARDKGLGFQLEIDPAVGDACTGDPLRVRQVLANLLSNAVKFTSVGRVEVSVQRCGDTVSFRVRDTGPGVAPDQLEHIFERFAQADSSATRSFGGAGLGLSICRELVQVMGGRMRRESALGEGSTFGFEVPLPPCAVAEPAQAPAGPENGEPRAVRILAAEDNATNAVILRALLEPADVELQIVEDGAQAVEAFAGQPYDVVLMDIQMPNMNGVDAARAIRSAEAAGGRPRTPILAVTANVMDQQVAEYFAAGMNGVVSKPIQAETLFAAIDAALAGAQPGAAAAA